MTTPRGERLELDLPSGIIMGREVWRYGEVGSTNDVLKKKAASGAREGLCVMADSQTRGRGRLGRSWASPPEVGLYLSCLIQPDLPPEALPVCTLMAGGAAARALIEATGAEVKLKWPNDLLLEGKKLGGILTELVTSSSGPSSVVVGIGVNVSTPPEAFPPELRPAATSILQATGRSHERLTLLKALLLELDSAYSSLRARGPEAALELWQPFSSTLGQRVRVETAAGEVEGQAVGLSPSGQLVVRTDQGLDVEVVAGEVVHLESGQAT